MTQTQSAYGRLDTANEVNLRGWISKVLHLD